MQRRKKQLLGAIGLVSVIAMTGIACTLPAPDAAATSGDTTIKVVVEEGGSTPGGGGGSEPGEDPGGIATLSLEFDADGLQDGDMIRNQIFTISTKYKNIRSISYSLGCSNSAGDVKNFTSNSGILSSTEGTHTTSFDLTALSGPYACKLTATGTNSDGTTTSDTINLTYRALMVQLTEILNDSGDPLVKITTRDDVAYFLLYVYHRDSRIPVFVNADGVEEPIKITADMFAGQTAQPTSTLAKTSTSSTSRYRLATAKTSSHAVLTSDTSTRTTTTSESGTYSLYLPMSKYNAPSGEYTLVSIAYDSEGNVISINEDPFTYKAAVSNEETPGVPGTGSILQDLNISRADFLITGLVAFALATIFAIRFLAKKHKA